MPMRMAPVASLSSAKRPAASSRSSRPPRSRMALSRVIRSRASTASATVGGSFARIAFRPEQARRLGGVADIIARQLEQHRVDAFHQQVADRDGLDRRKVEPVGQRSQCPAAIRIRRLAQIIGDELQLAVAAARIDQRVDQGGKALHRKSAPLMRGPARLAEGSRHALGMKASPPHHPSDGPPPRAGEEPAMPHHPRPHNPPAPARARAFDAARTNAAAHPPGHV